jgi:hypothetical protein
MFMRRHAWIGPIVVCCTQFMLHAFYVAFYTACLLCGIHLWGIPWGKCSKVYHLAAFIPTHALLQHTLCEGWVWSTPNQTMPCQGKLWWCLPPSLPPSLPAIPSKENKSANSNNTSSKDQGSWNSAAGWLLGRVGQDHTFTVYIRYFWQGIHRI